MIQEEKDALSLLLQSQLSLKTGEMLLKLLSMRFVLIFLDILEDLICSLGNMLLHIYFRTVMPVALCNLHYF